MLPKKGTVQYQTESLTHIFRCLLLRLKQIVDEIAETKSMPPAMAQKMAGTLTHFIERLRKYKDPLSLNPQDIGLLKNLKIGLQSKEKET